MAHKCLEENTVVELVAGRLPTGVAAQAREHVEMCPHCRELVAQTLLTAPGGAGDGTTVPPNAHRSFERHARIGRYLILDLLGAGGMGVVYLAHDPELDRRIALKLLRGEPGDEAPASAQSRLLREAQALARLSHPNVVAVYDVGSYGGRVFLAMEYVEGSTLTGWLQAQKRSWRTTLAAFISAGKGLAAAHRAGLVHRDFKPDNVLVGEDGRVRVTDFGLARPASAEASNREPQRPGELPGAAVSPRCTPTPEISARGLVVGTPAYMSPEQHTGAVADARSDQFAFCVALYEALHGARPPVGAQMAHVRRVPAAPPGGTVPAALRRIVARGLSRDASDRHPSMDVLLRALTKRLHVARRRSLAAALVVLLGAAGSLGYLLSRKAPVVPCAQIAHKALSAVWNPGRRHRLQAVFLASRRSFALSSWHSVDASVRSYTRQWLLRHRAMCTEARKDPRALDGESSPHELRRECLEHRLEELAALLRLFEQADPGVIERAPQASSALTPIAGCVNPVALRAPEDDPRVRSRLERARRQLITARVSIRAGRIGPGSELAKRVLRSAVSLRDQPLVAEAHLVIAYGQWEQGRYQDAASSWLRAVTAAEQGRHDVARARALISLAWYAGGIRRNFEESHRFAEMARSVLRRTGGNRGIEADLLHTRASVAVAAGRYDDAIRLDRRALAYWESAGNVLGAAGALGTIGMARLRKGGYARALDDYRQALAIYERVLGRGHPLAARQLTLVATVLAHMEKWSEALETNRRAIAILRRARGPDHPDLARALNNHGAYLNHLRRPRDAVRFFREALTIREKRYGRDDPKLTFPLTGLGEAHLAMGDDGGAVAPLRRALRLQEMAKMPPKDLADTRFVLARALWGSGRDRRRAPELARAARSAYRRLDTPAARRALARVQTWLRKHGRQ